MRFLGAFPRGSAVQEIRPRLDSSVMTVTHARIVQTGHVSLACAPKNSTAGADSLAVTTAAGAQSAPKEERDDDDRATTCIRRRDLPPRPRPRPDIVRRERQSKLL